LCGDELVERDRVAESPRAGVGRGGEEGFLRGMSSVDAGVTRARDDRELITKMIGRFEVIARDVVPPAHGGEKVRSVKPERDIDRDESPHRFGRGAEGLE